MTKNTTGGKGHRSQRAENPKAVKNHNLVDLWISDLGNTFPENTLLGRVTKRMGNGRMEVFAQDSKGVIHPRINVPLRGGMTGRSKSSVWVDTNKLVLICETGLAGSLAYEIFAVLEDSQISAIKKNQTLDKRFFSVSDDMENPEDTYEFEKDEEEVDIDAI
jgi:hypothetical protein